MGQRWGVAPGGPTESPAPLHDRRRIHGEAGIAVREVGTTRPLGHRQSLLLTVISRQRLAPRVSGHWRPSQRIVTEQLGDLLRLWPHVRLAMTHVRDALIVIERFFTPRNEYSGDDQIVSGLKVEFRHRHGPDSISN